MSAAIRLAPGAAIWLLAVYVWGWMHHSYIDHGVPEWTGALTLGVFVGLLMHTGITMTMRAIHELTGEWLRKHS